jgi:hypothetical protein
MKKLLKNIVVNFISLVKKGANQKEIIWKTDTGKGESIAKTIDFVKSDEKQMVYGIVYSPDEFDSQNEKTTAEEIEKASMDFMKNLRLANVDKEHSFQSEKASVVESWIVKSDTDPFLKDAKKGSWCVAIHIEDKALWDEIKKGEITGLSMAGFAAKESIQEDSFAKSMLQKAQKVLEEVLKLKPHNNSNSENQELKTLLDKIETELADNIAGNPAKGEPMIPILEEINKQLKQIEKLPAGPRSHPNTAADQPANDLSILLKSDETALVSVAKTAITPSSQRIGGVLIPQAAKKITDFFFRQDLFSQVTTIPSTDAIRNIDVFSLSKRIITRVAQGTAPDSFVANSNTGRQLVMKPADLFAQILFETLWDNQSNPNWENDTAKQFLQAFADDLCFLAFEGVDDDYDGTNFNTLNKGWIQLAKEAGSTVIDTSEHVSGSVTDWPSLFAAMLASLPAHYKSPYLRFFINVSDWEQYQKQLGAIAADPAATTAGIQKSFLGYQIFPNMYTPAGKVLLSPAPNLVFGVQQKIQRFREEVPKTRTVDYTFVASFDYQIARPDAVILAEDVPDDVPEEGGA